MNKLTAILLVSTAFLVSSSLNAQVDSKPRKDMSPTELAEARTEKMTTKLNLSEAQKAQVLQLNLEHAAEMQELKAKLKALKEEKRALQESVNSKLEVIMTEEQQATFKEIKENRKQRHAKRCGKHHNMPPPGVVPEGVE